MAKVTSMEAEEASKTYDDLPAETVIIDQIVAGNIRHWRREAGMTQEELGKRIGWSAANVSAAERSADSDRERRRFDAHTIVTIALALSIPVPALFLPPDDDGVRQRYIFREREDAGGELSMQTLMKLVIPDYGGDVPIMDKYRRRYGNALTFYIDSEFSDRIDAMFREATAPELRAERASRLRRNRAALLETAAELGGIADALDRTDES